MLNVITSTFSRIDCLRKLAESLEHSTLKPDRFVVVNHMPYPGARLGDSPDPEKEALIKEALDGCFSGELLIITLDDPGAAASANFCLSTLEGEKIFCGDDIEFEPDAVEQMLAKPGAFVIPGSAQNAFCCCLMRDELIQTVGQFDPAISPRYMYFEDCDYAYRMKLLNVPMTVAEKAAVRHASSQTYKNYTKQQMADHHTLFAVAQHNYVQKWGGTPYNECFTSPYGR